MKKLMTVMASAATALFAIGAVNGDDQPLNATSFEALNAGDPLDVEKTDAGEVGDTYWAMDTIPINDNGTVVSNEAANASSRPDYFESASKKNTLHLDTSTALYRTVKPNATTNDAAGKVCWKDETGEAIGDGIYLDTLVKFTAADDVFGADALATGDKIAISYVEQSDEVDDPITNFVIRAGYIGANELTVTNYEAKLDGNAEFDKDAWHRLTVRTIPNIDGTGTGKGHVGFAVYVDQTLLVYANATDAAGDSFVADGVAGPLYTNEKKAIFPSAVDIGDDKTTITAASFSGTGAIDDVVFTKVMPQFIAASSKIPVTFTIPSGVTSVDVTIREAQPVNVTAANPTVELPAGTTEFTIAVNIEQGSGYTFSGITGAAMDANNVVTVDGAAMEITINVSRNNFNLFNAQGQAISGMFETLTQALAAPGVAKIQLAYDYVVPADEIPENAPVFEIAGEVVLDLNGKTLNGGGSDSDEMFYVEGVLRVIDSSSANTGKIIYTGEAGVFAADSNAALYIGAAVGDYGPKIDGVLFVEKSEGLVVNAKVLASANTAKDAFVWADFVAEGSALKAAQVDGYWVVKPNGGDQGDWPATWNNGTQPASMATAFNAWVANNDPTAENAEAAFLVGVNVADYTSDLAVASISIVGGKVVITGNYDLTKINGALSIKMGDAPNALNTTTAINELTDGAISLTPALGETKKFYQLVIGYPAN